MEAQSSIFLYTREILHLKLEVVDFTDSPAKMAQSHEKYVVSQKMTNFQHGQFSKQLETKTDVYLRNHQFFLYIRENICLKQNDIEFPNGSVKSGQSRGKKCIIAENTKFLTWSE